MSLHTQRDNGKKKHTDESFSSTYYQQISLESRRKTIEQQQQQLFAIELNAQTFLSFTLSMFRSIFFSI